MLVVRWVLPCVFGVVSVRVAGVRCVLNRVLEALVAPEGWLVITCESGGIGLLLLVAGNCLLAGEWGLLPGYYRIMLNTTFWLVWGIEVGRREG